MKLSALIILALFIVYSASAPCTATCTADNCCSTADAAASPQTCTTSMKTGTVYSQKFTAADDKTCVAITVVAGSCVKADFTYAAAGATECVDANLKCQTMATSPYTQGYTTEAGKVCKALVAGTSCIDPTTKLWVDLTGQSAATDKATVKCITSDKACQLLYSSNAFTHGWTSATDFTCVAKVTTAAAPKCIDPLTYITSSAALTATSTSCLGTDGSCQPLAYANAAKRYTFASTTAGSLDFACALDTLKCGTAVCQLSECCTGTTCTASSTATTKKCLTSATDLTCIDQTATQYFKATGDASCDSTITTKTTQCIDTTTRYLKTLTATSALCVHTDSTCKATTATLVQTSTTDFTCKDTTATTTTTTTTTGANLLYIIGTIILSISAILI